MKPYEIELLLQQPRQAAIAAFGEGRIARIVPVAWPLLKSEWNVIVSVSEPIGIVDRFILRALRDFGPCSIRELDSFVCLGEDRTAAAIEEMRRIGAPIEDAGEGRYSVRENNPMEEFKTEHQHRFLFLLNGLSGDLLPSNMLDRMRRIILSEEDFEEMPWIFRLKPILSGPESKALRGLNPTKALQASDANGIPYGFQQLVGNAPLNESPVFALGFVFVDMFGNTLLVAATETAEEITVPERYLIDNSHIPTDPVPTCESIADGFDPALVKIARSNSELCALDITVLDDAIWSLTGEDKKSEYTRKLVERLIRAGWYWHRFGGTLQYACFDLRPGDERTERAVLIRKAVGMLSEQADDIVDESVFNEWTANFLRVNGGSEAIMKYPFTLDEMLSIARDQREGAVLALQTRLGKPEVSPAQAVKRQTLGTRVFLDSSKDDFAHRIVDLIRGAQQMVCIVSPVIQEDEVFAALREVLERGVAIQVVTQLGNHRTGQFETSPEFKGYDIPRRRLAELGACVRDWELTVHAKMLLVDNEQFLFTTANLNENSLGTGAKNALEAGFLFKGGPEVAAGCRIFNAIWKGAAIRQAKRDDRIAIVRMPQQVRSPIASDCMISIGEAEVILSTPSNRFLAKRIAALLRAARKNVLLVTMSIYDLEKVPIIFSALCGALSRGVSVMVLARTGAEQFKPEDWPDPSTKKLMGLGLKIVEVPHLHAKGLFVDGKIGMMMSANLNPYSLGDFESSHVEIAVQAPCSEPSMDAFRRFALSLSAQGAPGGNPREPDGRRAFRE